MTTNVTKDVEKLEFLCIVDESITCTTILKTALAVSVELKMYIYLMTQEKDKYKQKTLVIMNEEKTNLRNIWKIES